MQNRKFGNNDTNNDNNINYNGNSNNSNNNNNDNNNNINNNINEVIVKIACVTFESFLEQVLCANFKADSYHKRGVVTIRNFLTPF